ncbi:hypothetical protein [Paenibacillus crassostreae]|uniref:Uncharacterized protein n=1 Tax=Paenibacillus crassostreae TaxID=1763538 RepID=A0A167EJW0_9BACL|nr:hypothetical protein [Paenibacillus crassostreae]AOZ94933.1 hypothetical protein LPB68_21990 [Paenibacillus crassostreae]OAB75615.1 hypothetical protein PNBC_08280 [Paenibacillus crassostreae]
MGDKKRIEVTFDTDKHADILAAMKKFGNSAGFLKFAATHYINSLQNNNSSSSPETYIQSPQNQQQSDRRRLPPGFGGQAISTRLNE